MSRLTLLRRGRVLVGPGSAPTMVVAPSFNASGDLTGSTVTAPVVGQYVYYVPGIWLNTPTSFTGQLYLNGSAFGSTATWSADDPVPYYQPQEEDIGKTLRLGIVATNGLGSSSEALSTTTSATLDRDLSGSAPVLTRTSTSGGSPLTASQSAFTSHVYEGDLVQRVLSTSNLLDVDGNFEFADTVYNEAVTIDADTISAPNSLAWPSFDDSGYGQLYEMRRVLGVYPGGGEDAASPWSNMVKKSDALTNSTAYTKYRIHTTNTASGFYTMVGEFKVSHLPGGGFVDTANATGVTISGTNPASPASNARDGNLATGYACSFDGLTAFPHDLILDYSGGGATPIAANEFRISAATGGGSSGAPRNFTIDGWDGSAWVNLVTQVGVLWVDGETKPYVL